MSYANELRNHACMRKIKSHQQNIMEFFDVKTLNDFAVCFTNSGMYDEAFEVYETLENIYPAKTSIDIADILDSLGDYKKALEKLFEVDNNLLQSTKWFEVEITATKEGDFFYKKQIDYNKKSKAITADDLF